MTESPFLTARTASIIVDESLHVETDVVRTGCTSASLGCLRAYGSGALRRASRLAGGHDAQLQTIRNRTTGRCTGCEYAIDLTCSHRLRLASFHKFFDCLLPHFGLIRLVLALPARHICLAIEDSRSYATFAVQALLGGVPVGGGNDNRTWHVLRPDGGGPANLTMLHTLPGTSTSDGKDECVSSLPLVPSSSRLAQQLSAVRGSPGAAVTTQAIHALVRRQIARLSPSREPRGTADAGHVVLIQRANSRSFRDLPALSSALETATGQPVRIYHGSEPALSTLLLFATASSVVGVHGAGLLNSVWAPHAVCVVELTSHVDDHGRVAWRSCGRSSRDGKSYGVLDVRPWSPHLKWSLRVLPLVPLLDTNAAEQDSLGRRPCAYPSGMGQTLPEESGRPPKPATSDEDGRVGKGDGTARADALKPGSEEGAAEVGRAAEVEVGRAADAGRVMDLGPLRCYNLSLSGGSTSYFQKRNFSKCKYRLTLDCWKAPLDAAGRVRDPVALDQHLRFIRYVRVPYVEMAAVAKQLVWCRSGSD